MCLQSFSEPTLLNGDCLTELKAFEDNSIDSLITDPPAGISFMGKHWDSHKDREHFINEMQAIFTECLRVMKPGAHGLVWAIPRTSHWTATALENAGFEIRDIINHIQGMGFPKSLNVGKALDKQGMLCQCSAYETKTNMPNMSENISTKKQDSFSEGEILQQRMLCKMESTESTSITTFEDHSQQGKSSLDRGNGKKIQSANDQREQSCVEGGQIHRTKEGLCNDTQSESSESKTKWLCARTYSDNGKENQSSSSQRGDNSSYQPQHTRQSARESNAIQDTQRTLDRKSQDRLYCSECGKIKRKEVEGLGTGLKPACEHWILIRKPISEKSIAENVIKWGVGGINIDGCRIEADKNLITHANKYKDYGESKGKESYHGGIGGQFSDYSKNGRFPANLVFSHSEDCTEDQCSLECAVRLLDEQSGKLKSGAHKGLLEKEKSSQSCYGKYYKANINEFKANEGYASRFFYCAKISSSERNAGLEDMPDKQGGIKNDSGRGFSESDPYKQILTKNNHPTVKTKKLMSYLCRLITPPNGIILDPFMGSGSTGIAALSEGFKFVGIERELEYYDIARARINGNT